MVEQSEGISLPFPLCHQTNTNIMNRAHLSHLTLTTRRNRRVEDTRIVRLLRCVHDSWVYDRMISRLDFAKTCMARRFLEALVILFAPSDRSWFLSFSPSILMMTKSFSLPFNNRFHHCLVFCMCSVMSVIPIAQHGACVSVLCTTVYVRRY